MEALTAADPPTIGEFRLRARLGAGGMGQVFLATSLAGRMVAVKVIHPELGRDQEFIRRFRGEVNAAARVSGIYTAPVVAAGVDDIPPWLATAFVPGPSLADVVSRPGPLPEPALWRLAGGLAEALRAIHSAGLVHRDLKPANVLLASDGPRVIDFGIARALTESRLTTTGSVIGTPGFMSPEQVEGLECGPPSDVFSLGSVLAFAACGAAPFNGGPSRSSASVMYRVVHAEPDLASVPESVRQLVAACLAKDPGRRPDLGQVAAHCAAMADYLGLPATAFWPPEVAQVIQAAQASLTAGLQELQSAPVAPAQWAGPGMGMAGMGAAGMVTPARSAAMTPPAGPSGAGGWDRVPTPGFARDGRTGATSRLGMSRRQLLIGAGAAGAVVVGGTAWWALAARLPGTHAVGYQSPQTGAPGTGSGAAGSSAGPGAGTGASAAGPGSPQLAWAFTTGNAVEANPGTGKGVVYVGSRDNYVYAIDIATGKQAWKCLVGWVTAAPVLVGDMVCAATTTGGFYAIHAASGVVAWQLTTDVPAAFKPNFAADGGTVYLPSATKPLQAYDAATGGSVMTFGSLDQYTGAVAVAGGLLFVVDQSGTLHALRAATGATVWNASVIGSGDAPGTGLVVGGGAVYLGSSTGVLYSVNASNGTPNWSYQTGGTLISNPVVANGIVYVCDANGNLHAVQAQNGKQAWSRPAGAGGESGPAVAGGQVYVSTGLALQAYDAKSGNPAWSYTPPNTGGLVSTPAVAGGLIFIGSSNDNLYALRA